MQLKPEEISKVIRSQIKYYENAIRQDETGTVLMVGDGIARASGLSNCMEMCIRDRQEMVQIKMFFPAKQNLFSRKGS